MRNANVGGWYGELIEIKATLRTHHFGRTWATRMRGEKGIMGPILLRWFWMQKDIRSLTAGTETMCSIGFEMPVPAFKDCMMWIEFGRVGTQKLELDGEISLRHTRTYIYMCEYVYTKILTPSVSLENQGQQLSTCSCLVWKTNPKKSLPNLPTG